MVNKITKKIILKDLSEIKKAKSELTRSDLQGLAEAISYKYSKNFMERMRIDNEFLIYADGEQSKIKTVELIENNLKLWSGKKK